MLNPTKIIVSIVLALLFLTVQAQAVIYPFTAISSNSTDPAGMAAQLSLEVTDYGSYIDPGETVASNHVLFDFINASGPIDGVIGSVFFEDGALLTLSEILDEDNEPVDYAGVNFDNPDTPVSKNFPDSGDLSPPFETTAHFWASFDGDLYDNGVNTGEKVGIVFSLEGGADFFDVITAIGLGFTNPDPDENTSLRIGVHVQNLPPGTEKSDAFILTPIPPSVIIGLLGMGIAGIKLRKFA